MLIIMQRIAMVFIRALGRSQHQFIWEGRDYVSGIGPDLAFIDKDPIASSFFSKSPSTDPFAVIKPSMDPQSGSSLVNQQTRIAQALREKSVMRVIETEWNRPILDGYDEASSSISNSLEPHRAVKMQLLDKAGHSLNSPWKYESMFKRCLLSKSYA